MIHELRFTRTLMFFGRRFIFVNYSKEDARSCDKKTVFALFADKLALHDNSVKVLHRVVIRPLVPGIFVYNVRGIRSL